MRLQKSYVAEFKAGPVSADGTAGYFEALVSIFGNVDLQQDRVVKGAFDASLKSWQSSGDPLPIIWSHDWDNPMAIIGHADPNDVTETDVGLLVKGYIDLTNPFAAQVHSLMKRRLVKEFSFAYDVVKQRPAKDGANDLVTLDIIEAGPTLKGANPETQLIAMKMQKLLEAAGRKDVYAAIAGSEEERRDAIRESVNAWGDANYPADPMSNGWGPYVCIAATFGDHVLVSVEKNDAEDEYFEIPYAVDADGAVALGTPAPASVEVTVTAKAAKVSATKEAAVADDEELKAEMPMPGDAAGMRAHLTAGPPDGHGKDSAAVEAAADGDLAAEHVAAHAAAGYSDHTHPGMTNGPAKDEGKALEPDGSKAFDETAWDGAKALSEAVNADDPAAALNEICAGKRAGDATLEASHALPHHYVGQPANVAGVSAALGRFGQTQGLTNSVAAKAHLDAHEAAIAAAKAADEKADIRARIAEAESGPAEAKVEPAGGEKSGRVLSGKNEGAIKSAVDNIDEAVAELRGVLDAVKKEPEIPGPAKSGEPEAGATSELEERREKDADLRARMDLLASS